MKIVCVVSEFFSNPRCLLQGVWESECMERNWQRVDSFFCGGKEKKIYDLLTVHHNECKILPAFNNNTSVQVIVSISLAFDGDGDVDGSVECCCVDRQVLLLIWPENNADPIQSNPWSVLFVSRLLVQSASQPASRRVNFFPCLFSISFLLKHQIPRESKATFTPFAFSCYIFS